MSRWKPYRQRHEVRVGDLEMCPAVLGDQVMVMLAVPAVFVVQPATTKAQWRDQASRLESL